MKNHMTLTILFSTLSIFLVVASLTVPVYAQENITTSDVPKFFAIQHAQSGLISEINQTFTLALNNQSNKTLFSSDIDKSFSLELYNVSDKTILFSDRPDRIVTSVSTSDFIGNWTTGDNSFAVDAPNAVLIVDEIEGKQGETIIELFNPVYEQDSKILKYIFALLNTTTSLDSFNFGSSTLLIDITQIGDSISNLISQTNSIINNSVRGK
jgi:hypothetical protein